MFGQQSTFAALPAAELGSWTGDNAHRARMSLVIIQLAYGCLCLAVRTRSRPLLTIVLAMPLVAPVLVLGGIGTATRRPDSYLNLKLHETTTAIVAFDQAMPASSIDVLPQSHHLAVLRHAT